MAKAKGDQNIYFCSVSIVVFLYNSLKIYSIHNGLSVVEVFPNRICLVYAAAFEVIYRAVLRRKLLSAPVFPVTERNAEEEPLTLRENTHFVTMSETDSFFFSVILWYVRVVFLYFFFSILW